MYSLFLAANKEWQSPSKKDILVYDWSGSESLVPLLTQYQVAKLSLRGESINAICLLRASIKAIFNRNGVIENYINDYIIHVSPKIIITYIDNSISFYKISKKYPEIKTIFIQNGYRSLKFDVFERIKYDRDFYVDYMLVFGSAIGELYKRYITGDVLTIGSLLNNAIPIKKSSGNYILFISQFRPEPKIGNDYLRLMDGTAISHQKFYEAEKFILPILAGWAKSKNKILKIAGVLSGDDNSEFNFFKNNIGGAEFEYIPKAALNGPYELVDSASMIVFVDSTLGYEALARTKKIAALSLRGGSLNCRSFNFGWPLELSENGPFWTNEVNENQILRVLNFVLQSPDQLWSEVYGEYARKIIRFDSKNSKLASLLGNLLEV